MLEKIKVLSENRILQHCQIVLCPGINDGETLEETVFGLFEYYPYLETVAIVPVGLTNHRDNLPRINPVTKRKAIEIVDIVKKWQNIFKEKTGNNFVFLSDEFYFLSNMDLPEHSEYDDFNQIENGVGLTRCFLKDIYKFRKEIPKNSNRKINIGIITGILAKDVLNKHFLPLIDMIKNVNAFLFPVRNKYFGESVKVSGLLAGRDISETIKKKTEIDLFLLPPNCLNHDKKFIDNMTFNDMEKLTDSKIIIFDKGMFVNYLKDLN